MITINTNVHAGITGFENPTVRFRENPLNLQELFVHSHSSMRLISAENTYKELGIARGDWLLVDVALQPLVADVVLIERYGESHICRWVDLRHKVSVSGDDWSDLCVVGVITLSIHHFRQPPLLPWHSDLTEIDLHQLLVTQDHSTILCRASGLSMLPFVYDGDILVLERHVKPESGDVIVLSLNNDLVVKRVNLHTRTLYSDNPSFRAHRISQDDYTRLHGVVRYNLRLHRPISL
ncbi:S24 family peptidase [Vibrio parahaemolyticus]|nr:S24 family peptidase [Vibrio parahaemolyticus]